MKAYATITVIGRDKTGVVARITSFLFEQKANIEALEEQVTRGQFSMTLQASWRPAQLDAAAVQQGLARLAAALRMEIKLRFTEPNRRQRMAIMVTREPLCAETILDTAKSGRLPRAQPVVVLGSRPNLARWSTNTGCRLCMSRGRTGPGRNRPRCGCWRNTPAISWCWRAS